MAEPSKIEETVNFVEENDHSGNWPENSSVWVAAKICRSKTCKIITGENFTESRIQYLWLTKTNNNHGLQGDE